MSSQKESKTFFWFASLFLAMVFSTTILLLLVLIADLKEGAKWLSDYGGLIGSIFAVVIASYTIKKQSQNTRKQIIAQYRLAEMEISSQKDIENKRLFKEKIEEAYSVVFSLRLRIYLTRTHIATDSLREIDIFNYDVERVVMLCELHNLVSPELSERYWKASVNLLVRWSEDVKQFQEGRKISQKDRDHLERLADEFFNITEEFKVALVSRVKPSDDS